MDNAAATSDEVRKGDAVRFAVLRADDSVVGEPVEYRVGEAPPFGWTPAVEECLLRMRAGDVGLWRAPPIKVRMDAHVPRRLLPSGRGYVDITRAEARAGSKKKPQAGAVVWYLRDGVAQRRRLPLADPTPEDEAIGLLSPGQAGGLYLFGNATAPLVRLESTHAAAFEDLSAQGDGSLWKLSLSAPLGAHERARMGKTVKALRDGQLHSWRWGHGAVEDVLEFVAFHTGAGETCEIYASREDAQPLFTMNVVHVGDDMSFVAGGLSIEEASNAAAKALYCRGRLELAWWHWSYVRDSLRHCMAEEETAAPKQLALQAVGNLSVCALALGRGAEALALARLGVQHRALPRAADWLRVAKAAHACNSAAEAADALKRAARGADLTTPAQKRQMARLQTSLRERREAQGAADADFCRRALGVQEAV